MVVLQASLKQQNVSRRNFATCRKIFINHKGTNYECLTKNKSFDFLKQNAIYFVLLILLGIIIAQDPTFLNVRNFSNILTQSSVRLIIALGVAGLLILKVPTCQPVAK